MDSGKLAKASVLSAVLATSSCSVVSSIYSHPEIICERDYSSAELLYYHGLWKGSKSCSILAKQSGVCWMIMRDQGCDGEVDSCIDNSSGKVNIRYRIEDEEDFKKDIDPKFKELKDRIFGEAKK